MAFFKFLRKDQALARVESVEVLRRRAKHRLVGAALLVLAGVVVFALVFDKPPRAGLNQVTIEIPDKNKVKPLPAPAPLASAATSAAALERQPVAASAQVASGASASGPVRVASQADLANVKPVVSPGSPSPAASAAQTEQARALAALEGRSPEAAAPAARWVVQIGAFADVAKARETRLRLERAGLKTYTQVVDTKEGRRIRVRLGPFATKEEAQQAADKTKPLDLPAAVMSL